jgi:hypothetical protein
MIQYDSFMGPGQGYDESTPFLHLHPRYVRTYGFQQHSCRPARDKSDMVASREQPEEAICRGRISSNRYKIKDVATRPGWYMHGFVRHLLIFLGRKYTTSLDAMCGGGVHDRIKPHIINHVSVARSQKPHISSGVTCLQHRLAAERARNTR